MTPTIATPPVTMGNITTMDTDRSLTLVRLLQLASPTLPVGAYSYSQGLEAAIEARIVTDAATAEQWIADLLQFAIANMEAPLLYRLLAHPADEASLNATFLASRETAELRAETLQMGYSLNRLLPSFGVEPVAIDEPAYPTVFAAAARAWSTDVESAVQVYLWSWLENQVMAAVKAVPLGQTDGQKMLLALADRIPEIATRAGALSDEQLGNFAPGLAILSSQHETQYSRLFRS